MNLNELYVEFGSPSPPAIISEEPFEGGRELLANLCAAEPGQEKPQDLVTYALDLIHVDDLQPELLAYLFPRCLDLWKKVLFDEVDSTFNEHFHQALARRPILEKYLTSSQRAASLSFMRESLLAAMAGAISGKNSDALPARRSCHWMSTFASFGTFADIESLWWKWWDFAAPGHAIAALRYASVLIYPEGKNPHAATLPWEYESLGIDERWRDGNALFLSKILTSAYLEGKIGEALIKISRITTGARFSHILSDFKEHKSLVKSRIELLPKLLTSPAPLEGHPWM
jgi:hypothetical protein